MAFDFKKEFKEFYMPKNKPAIVTVPKANYIAVRGKGNPNEEGGAYQQAISVLYAVAYTLKMSYKTDYKIEGFFEYVVPPLEGFWWQENVEGVDYSNKDTFNWISVIRLPDFVTKDDFNWAVDTATKKKKLDCSSAEFLTIDEGLCVQIMHIGPFDNEPESVAIMDAYLEENGYENDLSDTRLHHEIYMSDARKVAPEKWKTVIRHPITKAKYHHLIPRTYFSAWEHGSGTLYVQFCGEEEVVERNKDRIAGVTNYHSIIAGMPIVTETDAQKIFASLNDFEVRYSGQIITDALELNRLYYDFANWEIFRADGSPVSKKRIKAQIEDVKIRDIESLWSSKYEDAWGQIRDELITKVTSAATVCIPAFQKEYLMKFYTALDWRSIKSNIQFNETWEWLCNEVLQLNQIEIPEEERELPMLENAAEEMRHNLLLKFYRQYLNDDGVIYKNAMANLAHTSFHFLVADGQETFITSDNPVFVFRRNDGKLQGVLPISPRVLMAQGKNTDSDDKFYITHITEDAVRRYNEEIKKNAVDFVVKENK